MRGDLAREHPHWGSRTAALAISRSGGIISAPTQCEAVLPSTMASDALCPDGLMPDFMSSGTPRWGAGRGGREKKSRYREWMPAFRRRPSVTELSLSVAPSGRNCAPSALLSARRPQQ